MAIKIVIFDLFETLVSEFHAGRPSHTEVAQTLGLPVKEFQQEYQSLRLARLTGQFSDYTAILRYVVQKLGGNPPENTIKTLAEHRYSAGAAHLRRVEPKTSICSMKSPP